MIIQCNLKQDLLPQYAYPSKKKEYDEKRITDLTFRSPHHIRGLSDVCKTNSSILLSHFLLLWKEFSSSFQPLFGEYVFNKRSVSNSAKITRPSGSCFEAANTNGPSYSISKQWRRHIRMMVNHTNNIIRNLKQLNNVSIMNYWNAKWNYRNNDISS